MLTAVIARRRAILASAIALLAGGIVAGCDLQEDADIDRGRSLFVDNCGTCHALAEAGSAANIGPNLDAAFAQARADGMDQDTIEGVVEAQIENPREIALENPHYDQTYMPPEIVTGRDAQDVAAYVASVAGVPGIEPPALPSDPKDMFTQLGCAGCHTLAAANATGTVGPNLDDALPGQTQAQVEASIRDPEQKISASPFPAGGVMPPFDEVRLPEADLKTLVQYLLQNAGQ